MVERNCDKCVHHTAGKCGKWTCEGTVTVDDIVRRARLDAFAQVTSHISSIDFENAEQVEVALMIIRDIDELARGDF